MSSTIFTPLIAISTIITTSTSPIPIPVYDALTNTADELDVSSIYDEGEQENQSLTVASVPAQVDAMEGFTVTLPPPPPPVAPVVTTLPARSNNNSASSVTTQTSSIPIISNAAPLSGSQKDQVLQLAKQYVGVPYVFGGATPAGWDCSGYVKWVVGQVTGINLPHGVGAITRSGAVHQVSRADAQPGDLVAFPGNAHMGIFMGGNTMVHAPKPGDVTKVGSIWSSDVRFYSLNG
jgi:cell wall-associated NlpC family hydrolase